MSHFAVTVIIPKDTFDPKKGAERSVDPILAPYCERIEVEEYDRACHCLGIIALHESKDKAWKEIGTTIEDLRLKFREIEKLHKENSMWSFTEEGEAAWDELLKPFEDVRDRFLEAHPLKNSPDPTCDDCKGKGTHKSTYNPKSQWDWYSIGGRWTGLFDPKYKPEEDPQNMEVCDLCKGTGDRSGWVIYHKEATGAVVDIPALLGELRMTKRPWRERDLRRAGITRGFADAQAEHCNGCNGCNGKGIRTSFPTQWAEFKGDVMPVDAVNKLVQAGIKEVFPYAVITPDGEWHQRGKMGWFGMSSDEMTKEQWHEEVKKIFRKHAEGDYLAVVVDCHI